MKTTGGAFSRGHRDGASQAVKRSGVPVPGKRNGETKGPSSTRAAIREVRSRFCPERRPSPFSLRGARPSRRPAYGSKPDSSAYTHLSTAAIPLAPAQKPPALPPVPFGGSPRFIYACASTSCRHGRAGWDRRRMRGHAPSALHQDALTACPARRRAFRCAPLGDRAFRCVVRRSSARGNSSPLRPKPVAPPHPWSSRNGPAGSPLAASRGCSSSPYPPEQTDPVSSSVYSSSYNIESRATMMSVLMCVPSFRAAPCRMADGVGRPALSTSVDAPYRSDDSRLSS